MAKAKKKTTNNLLLAVLYIAIGAIFCIFKGGVLNWLMTAVGICLIIFGILNIMSGKLIYGIVLIVLGIVIICGGWLITKIMLIVFGVLVAIKGVADLLEAIKVKNLMLTIVNVVTIVIGVLLVVSYWVLVDWLFIVLGVIFIVNGVLALFGKKISLK